jgi:hypothetical protein
MKSSINQIKNTVDSIISKQDQAEERVSGMEGNMEEILQSDNSKEKNEEL